MYTKDWLLIIDYLAIKDRNSLFRGLLLLTNDELTDSEYFACLREASFECLPLSIWPTFSTFLIFCFYFSRLKAPKNTRNSENIGHIVLGNRPKFLL